jgi:hypothetical protein
MAIDDHQEGGVESFLSPKLTKRRKSEKTCFEGSFCLASPLALDPVGGPLGDGADRPAKILSPPTAFKGNDNRLPPGLSKLPPIAPVVGGSMSKDDKKEVLPRSVFVLVIERKESCKLFWMDLGVPFRSRICSRSQKRA